MLTFPLHVQITLSHFGMSTTDFGPSEPFPVKQLRTTMDVDCPEWIDWFHGGLQYQVVHHLFPRLPRHNLRQCVPLVRRFCQELVYVITCMISLLAMALSLVLSSQSLTKFIFSMMSPNTMQVFGPMKNSIKHLFHPVFIYNKPFQLST